MQPLSENHGVFTLPEFSHGDLLMLQAGILRTRGQVRRGLQLLAEDRSILGFDNTEATPPC